MNLFLVVGLCLYSCCHIIKPIYLEVMEYKEVINTECGEYNGQE
jgi:hypothetical protein